MPQTVVAISIDSTESVGATAGRSWHTSGPGTLQVPAILADLESLVGALVAEWGSIDTSRVKVEPDLRGFARLQMAFADAISEHMSGRPVIERGTAEWDGVWDCWAGATMASLIVVQGLPFCLAGSAQCPACSSVLSSASTQVCD